MSYVVVVPQEYYVPQNSDTSSDISWSDVKNEFKKAGSNFVDWVSSKLPKGSAKGNSSCANCHKNSGTIKFSKEVAFCSDKCKHETLQKYQKELGNRKCYLQGCQKTCYIENNGKVHDFCSKSHAQEYQKQQWQQQQWQQQQRQQQQKQQQQHYAHEKSCKFPGCKKSCYSEHGQTYDFCGKSHAEMYKQQRGQQQRGNVLYCQPQWGLTGPIYFYNRDEPYYEFTNFASYCVTIDNKVWPTTEHYFQAQKFVGTPYEETIQKMSFPREAFDFSRKPDVSYWRRSDWEQVKEDVMHKALLAKFTQHEDLYRLLLGTKDRKLVEHTKNDSYWGDGGDGTGRNRLGTLLMTVRETLRPRPPKVISLPPPPPQSTTAIHYENIQSKSPPHTDSNVDLMDITEPPDSPLNSPKGPSTGPLMSPHDVAADKLLCMPTNTKNVPLTYSEMPTTTSTSITESTAMGSSSHSTPNYMQNNQLRQTGQLVGVPSDSDSASAVAISQDVIGTSAGMAMNQPSLVGTATSQGTSASTHGGTQHLDSNTMNGNNTNMETQ